MGTVLLSNQFLQSILHWFHRSCIICDIFSISYFNISQILMISYYLVHEVFHVFAYLREYLSVEWSPQSPTSPYPMLSQNNRAANMLKSSSQTVPLLSSPVWLLTSVTNNSPSSPFEATVPLSNCRTRVASLNFQSEIYEILLNSIYIKIWL